MYYDYNRVLSFNSMFNFLVGERGCGKTYGITKFVIKQFLKKQEEFAYIRRYKSDLKQSVPTFFSSVNKNNEFPNHLLVSKNNSFYCDGKCCGHAMCLSTAQDLKSSNFDNVKTIIFDEFIIDERSEKILFTK